MRHKHQQRQRRLLRSLVLLALSAGAARGVQQSVYTDEDEYPPLLPPQLRYFKLDVEAEQLDNKSSSGGSSTSQRLFVAPSVGIGWNYFLYHPNLMIFSVLAEPGYTWQQFKLDGYNTSQDSLMLNGNFSGTVLPYKPYSTVLNYGRSHGEFHYDFFNSATVDSEQWGVTSGYRQGPVPVVVSYQHSLTDSTGLTYNSQNEQTTLNVQAQNERHFGDRTDLIYQYTAYNISSSGGFQSDTITHYLTATDIENFKKSSLSTSLYYSRFEEQGQISDNPTLSLDYNWQHTPCLRSFYDASVADYSASGSDSLNAFARAGIQHQLYDSLSSTLDVHGTEITSESFGSKLDAYSMGTGIMEAYTKWLGVFGQLSLSDSVSYDVSHQDSTSSQQLIPDESYAVPVTGLFFLKSPRVIAVQDVFYIVGPSKIRLDGNPGGDYARIGGTDPWQIQVYSTGPNHVPVSSGNVQVQVTYIIQSNPSGNYSTFNNQAEIRLSFWHSRASVYARYGLTENEADKPGFILENTREFQAGASLNWQNLRLDAGYTDRQSTLYNYLAYTLTEGYTVLATQKHTFGLNFNQQWTTFGNSTPGSGPSSDLTFYSFTGNYGWHPTASFNWNNEAGYQQQSGTGQQLDTMVFRSDITWSIGRLDFKVGYLYETLEYPYETRARNYVYLNLRRTF